MARIGKAFVEFFILTEEQRKDVGLKFLELGNIGAGALFFGSALSEGRIKLPYVVSGVLWWILTFCIYVILTKERGKRND
jgi:hypothetical protein